MNSNQVGDCPEGTFSINWQRNHILIECGGEHWLVDTGSPLSMNLEGDTRRLIEEELAGHPVDRLLGMDCLSRFYVSFSASEVTIQSGPFEEAVTTVPIRQIMGEIPVVEVRVGSETIPAIFDTGAQISYFPEGYGGEPVGEIEDFILMLNRHWRTTVRVVDFSLGGADFVVRAGGLPRRLQTTLSQLEAPAIIGSEIIKQSTVLLAMPEQWLGVATNTSN